MVGGGRQARPWEKSAGQGGGTAAVNDAVMALLLSRDVLPPTPTRPRPRDVGSASPPASESRPSRCPRTEYDSESGAVIY